MSSELDIRSGLTHAGGARLPARVVVAGLRAGRSRHCAVLIRPTTRKRHTRPERQFRRSTRRRWRRCLRRRCHEHCRRRSLLATIVSRHRDDNDDGAIPSITRFDHYERESSGPLPHLFQRRRCPRNTAISPSTVNRLLRLALEHSGIRGSDDEPLHMTAHDFRRMFATDAVTGGLPVHIAAKLLGHSSITTTQAYLAVFQDDLIKSYRHRQLGCAGDRWEDG